jgi:hypothetical protein
MFDWNAELELAKHQVVDLEEKIFSLREELQRSAQDRTTATPIQRILGERDQRILSVRMASLDRAKIHERFIERKIAAGTKVVKSLPYAELAEVCFKAAKWMPRREPADLVRTHASVFYGKSIAEKKASND